jgi:hypothetical protein
MNRSELIERYKLVCKTLELHPSQVVLSAGGACIMHGLRNETSDLDVHIPRGSLYTGIRTRARLQGKAIRHPVRPGQPTEMIQYYEWLSIAPIDHAFTTTEIDGVFVYDARSLLIQKLQLNRPKDQADIKALMYKYIEQV